MDDEDQEKCRVDLMDEDMERMQVEIDKRMRDLQFRKDEILNLDIINIQQFVWSFTNAYEHRDMTRCGAILDIMMTLSHTKPEIPTIQDYFGGERIGRYRGTIHSDKASEWITYVGELIKDKTDWHIQPERIN